MNEYFPEVAWRTIVDNVTVAPTPHYYTVDVFPLDSNEPGADPLDIAIGYWLIDNGGYTYLITDVSGSTITVYDINERSWGDSYIGPLEDLPGYVYKTKNGAFLLSQSQLRFLDRSAPDILYPIEKGIIWKYRGIEINALYGDGEVVETITEDSVDNITKLSLSSEFILRTEEDGWQGGKKYSLSLDGLLHNNLQDVQGTGLDDDYIHLDQDQIDALWTKDGLNITRDSAASLTGILSVDEIKSHTNALPLIKKEGNNVRFSTCILSDCVNNRVGIFTETPLDHLHLTGYARISTLAETANSSIVTSNADGRLIKLPYDNDESKYLRSDGTWARVAISLTTTGTSGAATYTVATGVLNIPQYQAVLTNPITGTGTTNQIAYFTGTTSLASLSTATYPSLTELSYVKGVTSALQTQLNSKQATLVSGTNIKTVATNSILGSGSLINITISGTEPNTGGELNGDIWVES